MDFGNFTITKREVLFSLVIVFVMIGIGFLINGAIQNNIAEKNEYYYKAAKITEPDMFQHALKTDGGEALVYGEFMVTDPVTAEALTGKYLYIEKVQEQYNMHTRIVTHTDSDGNSYTTTETYYEWDHDDSEEIIAKKIQFMGSEFLVDQFDVGWSHVETLNTETVSKKYHKLLVDRNDSYLYEDGSGWESVGDHRWYFNVVPMEFSGTILADLRDDNVYNVNNKDQRIGIAFNRNIDEVLKTTLSSEKNVAIVFWSIWVLLLVGAMFLFFFIDNPWLEDEARARRKVHF